MEDSLAQVARPPLLLLGGPEADPQVWFPGEAGTAASSYRGRLTTTSQDGWLLFTAHSARFSDTHVMPLSDMAVLLTYFSESLSEVPERASGWPGALNTRKTLIQAR